MKTRSGIKLPIIGWREWVHLPDLGIRHIKAKVDTGARSSCLHAFDIHAFQRAGKPFVRFKVHPIQRDARTTVAAEAPVLEFRKVKSSSGHTTVRPVILTSLHVLDQTWLIELTLANRDAMGFRMLLGREGVRGRLLVDPGQSYYGGEPPGRRRSR